MKTLPPTCYICDQKCEKPYMRAWNPYFNDKVISCSAKCHKAFIEMLQRIGQREREKNEKE